MISVPRLPGTRQRRPRRRVGARLVAAVAVVAAMALPTATPGTARAEEAAAAPALSAQSPTVWGMGDSLFFQCGDTLGLPNRSLGMVGWWGGTTEDMRARMSSVLDDWPYMSEPTHADEVANFRSAGTWVIGLGTNDVRYTSLDRFRANVAWFMQQSRGRPVLWFDIYFPPKAGTAAAFNAVLNDAAKRWPNLRVLGWNAYATAHPGVVLPDRVHMADHASGCERGRFDLIRRNAPTVNGSAVAGGPSTPPPATDPTLAKHAALGGNAGVLGAPTGPTACSKKDGGCIRTYAGGVIAWSPATGARAVTRPDVRTRWEQMFPALDTGPLGYPTADTVCGLPGGACRQDFQAGTIYASPRSGARVVLGPIRDRWAALGAENGLLGLPLTDTNCSLDKANGCWQQFDGGTAYWSVETRPQIVRGALLHLWGSLGWETSSLGYPLTDEYCGLRGGGCYQWFQGGTIYFSPATGAHVVRGAIHSRWGIQGYETGVLGYPTTSELCGLPGRGCYQRFQGGTMYWSPATGARAVRGAIYDRWGAQGWETGALGYPTTGEGCGLRDGGCYQWFQGGTIYHSPATGTHVVRGAIHAGWMSAGAERGRFGYPVGSEYPVPGGVAQRFQGGTLTWAYGRLR